MLFSSPAGHPNYEELRNNPHQLEYRKWLESLFKKAAGYLPPSFANDYQKDKSKFDSAVWEMILANCLLEHGITLVPDKDLPGDKKHGRPDICALAQNGTRVWFECVIPDEGTNENAVDKPNYEQLSDMAMPVDLNKNGLRFTSSIGYKMQQHQAWLQKGICKPNEPFIIAIHGKRLQFDINNMMLPEILSTVYPVGQAIATIEPDSDAFKLGYQFQQSFIKISKESELSIPKDSFLQSEYANVSGLLFSRDWGPFRGSSFSNYVYIPNVGARNPLSLDLSAFSQIYSVEINKGDLDIKKVSEPPPRKCHPLDDYVSKLNAAIQAAVKVDFN